MAELDYAEVVVAYRSLQKMELALAGAGVGGGMNNAYDFKVLNYMKAMRISNAESW